MGVVQDGLPLEAFEDPPERDGLSARQVATHELWETLHRVAWDVCIDPGPRVLDKLIMLHTITNPAHRVTPFSAEPALRLVMAEHAGNLSFERHVGRAIEAFVAYAAAVTPQKRKAPPTKQKVGVSAQSVDRDLGF